MPAARGGSQVKTKVSLFWGVPIFFYLLIPTIIYAQDNLDLRDKIIEETLLVKEVEAGHLPKESGRQEYPSVGTGTGDKTYITLGVESGYIAGNTAYDFDHHTSELEFPLNNWMIGGNLNIGLKNLSLNAEFWTPLDNDAGFNMKDKDWPDGTLHSYTKSKASMDAIIGDVNLRCDFYRSAEPQRENRIGILLGYKYERFDYDLYDLYVEVDTDPPIYQGQTLYPGRKIGTYWIKYSLPYTGLAVDLGGKRWGISMNAKYSFYPTAKDIDNHLVRGLVFYGDYDKHGEAWMSGIHGFWRFAKKWKLKLGLDVTFVRIDGRTWDETHDPTWDAEQSTDMRQGILWSGIEYKF